MDEDGKEEAVMDEHHSDPPMLFQINTDGNCVTCGNQGTDNDMIKCFSCKIHFHAVCPDTQSKPNKICTSSFFNLFNGNTTKQNFIWMCDVCITKAEANECKGVEDRIDTLQEKVEKMSDDMAEIKKLLVSKPVIQSADSLSTTPTCNPAVYNAWADPARVVICKNNLGEAPKLDTLEKSTMGKSIRAHVNKKGDTVISCQSPKIAAAVKQHVEAELAGHNVTAPVRRRPVISLVGFKTCYEPDILLRMIMEKNNFLKCYADEKSDCEVKDFFEITAVKPCSNDTSTFQAIIKVTDALKYAIEKNSNRMFVGLFSCRVYEQHFIKRCFNCQGYGHMKGECVKDIACAKCGGAHDTQSNTCEPGKIACVNCIRHSKGNVESHSASSPQCPCFIAERDRVKKEIEEKRKSLNMT